MSEASQVKFKKSLLEIRASFVYKWLSDIKKKAIENDAIIFYEGHPICVEDLYVTENSCWYKYSDTAKTILFDIDDYQEILEYSIKELGEMLKENFKLYKEIKEIKV